MKADEIEKEKEEKLDNSISNEKLDSWVFLDS